MKNLMKWSGKVLLVIMMALSTWTGTAVAQESVNIDVKIQTENQTPKELSEFWQKHTDTFIMWWGHDAANDVQNIFENIAYAVKNFAIIIAVIFLIIGVIKLLASDASDEDVKKWKYNIFWTAFGIFFLQISYSIWKTGLLSGRTVDGTNPINAALGWEFWNNIISPIVQLLQYLASFAFIVMMIYAFYVIVTGGGDEKKLEKGKNTLIFGLIGFIMIQVPYTIVSMLYAGVPKCPAGTSLWSYSAPNCITGGEANISGTVEFVGKIFGYFNGFLTLLCVLMAIYAGWLLLISKGDEEKVKKAKHIILYIAIGLVILVASHAIFRFFIMQG